MTQATLVFLRKMVGDQTHICIAEKKRGFAAGKWNGAGGKVQLNETVEAAAVREANEEFGIEINVEDLQPMGVMDFHFKHDPELDQQVHIYLVDSWQGGPAESEEMRPEWFLFEDIPYDNMWADIKIWLPRILQGEKLQGEFTFDDAENITEYNIVPLNLNELVL